MLRTKPRRPAGCSARGHHTEVERQTDHNVQSFREALNKADPRRGVLLYLDRKGNKTFAV